MEVLRKCGWLDEEGVVVVKLGEFDGVNGGWDLKWKGLKEMELLLVEKCVLAWGEV